MTPQPAPRSRIVSALVLALGLWWTVPTAAEAQGRRAPSTAGERAAQQADSAAIAALADSLGRAARTPMQRAAAVYEWVAHNVAYDVEGYLAGRIGGETPESVWRQRVAVCGGFVILFQRLAAELGLETTPIRGYAKGFDYVAGQGTRDDNHAWLAVRIDGRWGLVDPTWGAGVVDGGRFVPGFTWAYFLPDPEVLLLSHLPAEARWQLVPRRLARRDFERMAVVPRQLVEIGFPAAALRAAALTTGQDGFPTVGRMGDVGDRVRVLRAPLAATLRAAAAVEVEVEWPGASDVMLVSGDAWTPLARAGDRFSGSAPARPGPLWVVGRTAPGHDAYRTLLHYTVE
jgi:hypothetical protein